MQLIWKNLRFESQKIEDKDWANNLEKKFSSSCFFPRDYAIPTRRLVTLCVARGLVEELNDTS